MIEVKRLIKILDNSKINFFSGVPDSVLKKFSNSINNKKNHFIAVNEGSAVAMGIGYHLSTKKIPCVYFQNSGLGNAINPLVSIAHENVYSIPILLIIGWRGSPQFNNDEPQHNAKGNITLQILKLLKIKTLILRSNHDIKKDPEIESSEATQKRCALSSISNFIKLDVRQYVHTPPQFGVKKYRHHTGDQKSPPNPVPRHSVLPHNIRDEIRSIR